MNTVVLLSGGLDSQVLLAKIRSDYNYVHCIGFSYGQKHVRELRHADQIARYYAATFEVVELPIPRGSALTGAGEIPKGVHFQDKAQLATVVPNRNMVMLSVAAAIAATKPDVDAIYYAAHAGDAAIYADCRPAFVSAVSHAMVLGCKVAVLAPFLGMTKREIVQLGRALHVPMEDSWTCYECGSVPCQQCGACLERAEAMAP